MNRIFVFCLLAVCLVAVYAADNTTTMAPSGNDSTTVAPGTTPVSYATSLLSSVVVVALSSILGALA